MGDITKTIIKNQRVKRVTRLIVVQGDPEFVDATLARSYVQSGGATVELGSTGNTVSCVRRDDEEMTIAQEPTR